MLEANIKFFKISNRFKNILKDYNQSLSQFGHVPVLEKLPNHDLCNFMSNQTLEMQNEYKRIQKRVFEDPETSAFDPVSRTFLKIFPS